MEKDIIMRSDGYKSLDEFSTAIAERVEKARTDTIAKGYRPYATHSGIEVAWDPEKKDFVVFAQRVLFYETPDEAELNETFKQKNVQKAQAVSQKTIQKGGFFPSTPQQLVKPKQPAGQYAPQTDAKGRIEIAAAWRDKRIPGMITLKTHNGEWLETKIPEEDLKLVQGEITYTHEASGKVTVFVPQNSTNPSFPVWKVFADPNAGGQQ